MSIFDSKEQVQKGLTAIHSVKTETLVNPGFFKRLIIAFCNKTEVYQKVMHQKPRELLAYLTFISKLKVSTYIEVGVWRGGTLLFTVEQLKKTNTIKRVVACDISPMSEFLKHYSEFQPLEYRQLDSHGEEAKRLLQNEQYDLCLIDGNHSYDAVKADYETMKHHCRVVVFHDIYCKKYPDVGKFWRELKNSLQPSTVIEIGDVLGFGIVLPTDYGF